MKGRFFLGIVFIAALVAFAGYWGAISVHRERTAPLGGAKGGPSAAHRIRSFSLINSQRAVVTEQTFRGEWLIVFFGYTHCPDVCPAALFKLSKVLEALGDQGARVQVAFITIDPERDSPELLKTYMQAFGPRFIGLTGSQEQISAAEQAFGAYAEKQAPTADGNYGMKHSTSFYVLDPTGQFRRQISSESSTADLSAAVRSAMNPNIG